MRGAVLTGASLLALCVAAQADPPAAQPAPPTPPPATTGDPFAEEYANTLVETAPDGAKIFTHINEDRTWEQHLPDGSSERGIYRWQDDHTVCFTQTYPAPGSRDQATSCDEVHTVHKVGDRWTQQDAKGRTYTIEIVAGRH